jgi:hypothetical protein
VIHSVGFFGALGPVSVSHRHVLVKTRAPSRALCYVPIDWVEAKLSAPADLAAEQRAGLPLVSITVLWRNFASNLANVLDATSSPHMVDAPSMHYQLRYYLLRESVCNEIPADTWQETRV